MTPAPVDPARTHRTVATRLGSYVLAAGTDGLVGVWRTDQKHFPRAERLGPAATAPHPVLDDAAQQLQDYLAGTREAFTLPLAAEGTEFQQRVWRALLDIPHGETRSYGELAAAVGSPGAARAVGLANGRNPIGIIVPCHRVIGANGSLTGYGGGLERKQLLLDLERSAREPRLDLGVAVP